MIDDSIINLAKQDKFIKEVCKSQVVWALEDEEGYAITSSNEYEDDEGEPLETICFWSDRELAAACAQEEWEEYSPVEIPLGEFIEKWCIGMANDNVMVGINFDQEMDGNEMDSLELILEISNELGEIGKTVELEHYASLDVLVGEVEKILHE